MRSWVAVALLLVAGPAIAHDFYISPSSHHVATGKSVSLTWWVGSPKELDEIPRSNRRIIRFEAHLGDKVTAIEGKHGASPAGHISFGEPGVATIVYQSEHTYIELDPSKFAEYLHEEGLDNVIAERKEQGLEAIPGRESYARYAKSLVTVGDGKTGFDRKIGLPAELVAITDPRAGGTAQFQLFYEGKPRAGARVDLIRPEKTHVTSVAHAVTDAEGRVSFAIPSDGRWILGTTLMRRAPKELALEGEWESYWISLTFESGKPKSSGGCSTTGAEGSLLVALALVILRRKRSSDPS